MLLDPARPSPFDVGARTDTGGRRALNEDAVLTSAPVFCVADGMGGHSRGEVASGAVVGAFADLATRLRAHAAPVSTDVVVATLVQAQARIRAELGITGPETDGEITAGSTVAGVILTTFENRIGWLAFNVGDSRLYRYGSGGLVQVSVDHSVVQELLDAGELDADSARGHPMRNLITRAVGTGPAVTPDFWLLRANPGERLLLCTDGLVNELTEQEVGDILQGAPDPGAAADELLARAVEHGARDNVSVVVISLRSFDAVDEGTVPRLHGAYDPEDTVPRR